MSRCALIVLQKVSAYTSGKDLRRFPLLNAVATAARPAPVDPAQDTRVHKRLVGALLVLGEISLTGSECAITEDYMRDLRALEDRFENGYEITAPAPIRCENVRPHVASDPPSLRRKVPLRAGDTV